jgi:hypothetical protein
MNIEYTEINDDSQTTNLETNNYWEPLEKKKKPKFGYDDILSSINLVVNNGVLQYMTPTQNLNQQPMTQQYKQNQRPMSHQYTQNQQPMSEQYTQNTNVKKLTVDPQVKNSAIYNKYFKNYKDHEQVQEVKIPKTKEELYQMLIEEHNKRIQAQKRIALIKPKKMFFSTEGSQVPIYASQNHHTLNKLFKF